MCSSYSTIFELCVEKPITIHDIIGKKVGSLLGDGWLTYYMPCGKN